MLYRFLKIVFRFAIRQYFREVTVSRAEGIPKDKALIVLPNHTSAFMDPIVVAVHVTRPVFFLARGESFQNKLMSRLFRVLHMIPIYRREHTPDLVDQNEFIFQKCFEMMEEKGCLMIFPEGVSQMEPQLMPLKTGSARIALGAEARNDFSLDIHLLPAGINYTNSHSVQGKLFVNFGEPIRCADYKELYTQDPEEAVRKLTQRISDELSKRIVIVEDKRWQQLAFRAERLIRAEMRTFQEIAKLEGEGEAGWFLTRQQILDTIDYVSKNHGETELVEIEKRVDRFHNLVKRLRLEKRFYQPLGKYKERRPGKLQIALYFILTFPLFAIGTVQHIIQYKITESLANAIVKRDDFRGSVLLALGVLIFGMFWFGYSYLVYILTASWSIALIFLVTMPLLGVISFRYYVRIGRLISDRYVWRKGPRGKGIIRSLSDERDELIAIFRDHYEAHVSSVEKN